MRFESLVWLGSSLTLAGALAAAPDPFSDVPRTHWAYGAVKAAMDAGVLEGHDGKFMGDKLVNRYQMAQVVARLLKAAGSGKALEPYAVKNLEDLSIEFADELALLNTKVATLEESFTALRGDVDKLKAGSGNSQAGEGLASAFSGMVAVALVDSDDPLGATAPVFVPRTTYNLFAPDQTFFTIPQASIALDKEVGEGIGLHVQFDYATNGLLPTITDGSNIASGAAVALNEAYLTVEKMFGNVGAKIGGFALPFQSWEIDGAFRTSNMTITPSAANTLLEFFRVVGMEFSPAGDGERAVDWRLAVFSGGDVPPGSLTGLANGFMIDGVGLGGLSSSLTVDGAFGYYLDLESGKREDRNFGWRLGVFDLGGDNEPILPPTIPIGTSETDGFNAGLWWKNDKFKVIGQYVATEAETSLPLPVGGNFNGDTDSWYLLVNYRINDRSNISVRYDSWDNEFEIIPPVGVSGGLELDGDAFTFAFNRSLSDTSMLQFEWITPDEELTGTGALVLPAPVGDVDDDQVQLRYKVWF